MSLVLWWSSLNDFTLNRVRSRRSLTKHHHLCFSFAIEDNETQPLSIKWILRLMMYFITFWKKVKVTQNMTLTTLTTWFTWSTWTTWTTWPTCTIWIVVVSDHPDQSIHSDNPDWSKDLSRKWTIVYLVLSNCNILLFSTVLIHTASIILVRLTLETSHLKQ